MSFFKKKKNRIFISKITGNTGPEFQILFLLIFFINFNHQFFYFCLNLIIDIMFIDIFLKNNEKKALFIILIHLKLFN